MLIKRGPYLIISTPQISRVNLNSQVGQSKQSLPKQIPNSLLIIYQTNRYP